MELLKEKYFQVQLKQTNKMSRHFQMKTHNCRHSFQEYQGVSCPRLSYGHRISNLDAGSMRCNYDESYSFFNFKSAENEDTFEGKCETKHYQTVLWPQQNLKNTDFFHNILSES